MGDGQGLGYTPPPQAHAPAAPSAPSAPPAPPGPPAPSAPSAPGRGIVFLHVAWRSLVSSIGGGTVIVLLVIAGYVVKDAVRPPTRGTPTDASDLAYAMLGAVFGTVLGVPAALVMGGVAAWLTVPFRGRARTRLVARITALLLVVPFVVLLMRPGLDSAGDIVLPVLIWTAAAVGAWFLGGWTVRWYVRRMEPG